MVQRRFPPYQHFLEVESALGRFEGQYGYVYNPSVLALQHGVHFFVKAYLTVKLF
jgi:hypothetical protein